MKVKVEEVDTKKVKEELGYCEVPSAQEWRVAVVKDMLEVRWNHIEIDVIENDLENLDKILEELCVA